jgi:DNA-binding IclR family transcriptional regulator
MKNKSPYYRVKSVEKALKILEVISEKGEASLTELSQTLKLTKTNIHRLVLTLSENGFVIPSRDGSRYMLSLKIFVLAGSVNQRSGLVHIALPKLQKLSILSNETINLGVLYNDEVLYLHKIVSNESLHIDTPMAKSDPAYGTALGKCLLSSLNRDELEGYVQRNTPFKARTRQTITDPLKLIWELDATRRDGYALDIEEWLEGVHCIASLIKDENGRGVAAISITGPAVRMTEDKIRKLKEPLIRAAQEISRDLQKLSATYQPGN